MLSNHIHNFEKISKSVLDVIFEAWLLMCIAELILCTRFTDLMLKKEEQRCMGCFHTLTTLFSEVLTLSAFQTYQAEVMYDIGFGWV